MKNVKLQNLRFFVAVYEECSISAAARKVNATQSGVSVQVRDLEDQLGLALFDRISTGVAPTKAGERIYRRAVRILREVDRLSDDITALSDQLTGEVRVGIMPTFARAILAPALIGFSEANPLVDVKVTEGYSALLTQMVLAGELDLAVVPDGTIPRACVRHTSILILNFWFAASLLKVFRAQWTFRKSRLSALSCRGQAMRVGRKSISSCEISQAQFIAFWKWTR